MELRWERQAAITNSFVSVNPNQSTSKEFWINTVHLDGMTNLNGAKFCDTCSQNTPLHPAEKPPVNSTIPTGGGFGEVGYGSNGTTMRMRQAAITNSVVSVNPNQSTSKEFWINTVHLDGMTNLNEAKFCDTCSQNTPLHPAEKPL